MVLSTLALVPWINMLKAEGGFEGVDIIPRALADDLMVTFASRGAPITSRVGAAVSTVVGAVTWAVRATADYIEALGGTPAPDKTFPLGERHRPVEFLGRVPLGMFWRQGPDD